MPLHDIIAIAAFVAMVAFVVFAFRQGFLVKPDKHRKPEDWSRITGGGPDSGAGHTS